MIASVTNEDLNVFRSKRTWDPKNSNDFVKIRRQTFKRNGCSNSIPLKEMDVLIAYLK